MKMSTIHCTGSEHLSLYINAMCHISRKRSRQAWVRRGNEIIIIILKLRKELYCHTLMRDAETEGLRRRKTRPSRQTAVTVRRPSRVMTHLSVCLDLCGTAQIWCVWVSEMRFSLRLLQKSQKIIVIVARGIDGSQQYQPSAAAALPPPHCEHPSKILCVHFPP